MLGHSASGLRPWSLSSSGALPPHVAGGLLSTMPWRERDGHLVDASALAAPILLPARLIRRRGPRNERAQVKMPMQAWSSNKFVSGDSTTSLHPRNFCYSFERAQLNIYDTYELNVSQQQQVFCMYICTFPSSRGASWGIRGCPRGWAETEATRATPMPCSPPCTAGGCSASIVVDAGEARHYSTLARPCGQRRSMGVGRLG
jgi:hypothetical protein